MDAAPVPTMRCVRMASMGATAVLDTAPANAPLNNLFTDAFLLSDLFFTEFHVTRNCCCFFLWWSPPSVFSTSSTCPFASPSTSLHNRQDPKKNTTRKNHFIWTSEDEALLVIPVSFFHTSSDMQNKDLQKQILEGSRGFQRKFRFWGFLSVFNMSHRKNPETRDWRKSCWPDFFLCGNESPDCKFWDPDRDHRNQHRDGPPLQLHSCLLPHTLSGARNSPNLEVGQAFFLPPLKARNRYSWEEDAGTPKKNLMNQSIILGARLASNFKPLFSGDWETTQLWSPPKKTHRWCSSYKMSWQAAMPSWWYYYYDCSSSKLVFLPSWEPS